MLTGGIKLILAALQVLLAAASMYLLYSTQTTDTSDFTVLYLMLSALVVTTVVGVYLNSQVRGPAQKLTQILHESGDELDDLRTTIIRLKTYSDDQSKPLVMALTGLLERLNRKLKSSDDDNSGVNKELESTQQELADMMNKYQLLQKQPHQRSEFLSLMGDEITSPMQSLNSMLKLLNQAELDQEMSHLLKIAIHSAYSGMLELESKPFDLQESISQVLETQESIALSKSLLIEKHINADVPLSLNTNERAMKKVLNNLISNAIRFTDQGSINLKVDRIFKGEEPYLRFKVTDTGIGVPKEAIATLFDSLDKDTHLKNSSFTGRLRLIVSKG
ncbi:MAG: HAMP domain-containing sensor histidine kinase, partial [Gammaproteobacteria bacterium]